MSLEESFDNLAKAIREQTEVLKGGIAKATGTKQTAEKETTTKAETKAETAPKNNAKTKGPTVAELKEAFSNYIASVPKTDGAGRKVITDNVKAILTHFGVEQARDIPKENYAEAIGYVNQFVAGETPNFMAESGDEGDSGESLV